MAPANHVSLRAAVVRVTGIIGISTLPGQLFLDVLCQVEIQRLLKALDGHLTLDHGVLAIFSVLLHSFFWKHVVLLAQGLIFVLE